MISLPIFTCPGVPDGFWADVAAQAHVVAGVDGDFTTTSVDGLTITIYPNSTGVADSGRGKDGNLVHVDFVTDRVTVPRTAGLAAPIKGDYGQFGTRPDFVIESVEERDGFWYVEGLDQ